MGTQNVSAAQAGTKEIRVTRSVFDLDSKGEVDVVKVGQFAPVTTMQEFLSRLGNDSAKVLEIVNDGLESYERGLLAENGTAWQVEDEETGVRKDFSGTLISEEKSKQLAGVVLQNAKFLFGYEKGKPKEEKSAAKAKALEMVLSNPAVIEALKAK